MKAEIQTVIDALSDLQTVRFATVSAAALLVWDIIITFDREVELVWKKRRSIIKCLYLWNRYMGLILLSLYSISLLNTREVSDQRTTFYRCQLSFPLEGFLAASVSWSMQGILQIRLYVMYDNSERLRTSLLALFSLVVLAMSTILALTVTHVKTHCVKLPTTYMCIVANGTLPEYWFIFWVPSFLFDSVLVALAAWCAVRRFRLDRRSWDGGALMNILVRDSVVAFFVVFVCYAVTIICWITLPIGWAELPQGYGGAVTCVVASRLVLNIRESYYDPFTPTQAGSREWDEERMREVEFVFPIREERKGMEGAERRESITLHRIIGEERRRCRSVEEDRIEVL